MSWNKAAALGLVCFCSIAQANTFGVTDFTIYEPFISVRAQGMGNAFTALADDEYAIFYNPAGLARFDDKYFNFGIGAGVDSKVLKLKTDISNASGTGSDSVTQMENLLEQNYGNHYSLRAPTLNAFWVHPRWEIAIIPMDLNVEMEIHQLAGAALNVVANEMTTIAYARAWDVSWFGPNQHVSMGTTVKAVYRGYFASTFLASDLANSTNLLNPADAGEGLTVDADFGTLWTPHISPKSWLHAAQPTFGATVRNIGDYGYIKNFHLIDPATGSPPPLGRRLDVGSKFDLPDWWVFRNHLMADIRDIGDPNWTLSKGYHLGAEFWWKIRGWWQGGWRVGVSQGYFSAGFSGKFLLFQMDLVTYAEETGPSDAPRASRIYMARASLDF